MCTPSLFRCMFLSILLVTLVTAPTTRAQSRHPRSILQNGGFETDAGWTIGQDVRIVQESPHAGRACLLADGDRGAAAEQTVWVVTPGKEYTISGWVRTRDVSTERGGFAFLALYEYDGSGRIVRFSDFAKVTGTTDWTEYHYTARLLDATEYVAVRAGIYNATGKAWFDDVNLVEGTDPVPWGEVPGAARGDGAYRAAILDEPSLPVVGTPTPVATFRKVLQQERIALTSLTTADIENGVLTPERFDLFIVPTGSTFPVEARKALLAFVTAGGDLLCTGGYAFDHLVTRMGGRWVPYHEHLARAMAESRNALVPNGGFEEGTAGWIAEGPGCMIDDTVAASGTRSGRVRASETGGGGRWTRQLNVTPGRTYLVGARVRCEEVHGTHYAFLAVYQYDAAGKLLEFRDFAQLTGTRPWQRYEAQVTIHPAAARVLFHAGLYLAAGTLWLDDVTCGAVPQEDRINAHYGEPADALKVGPMQLTLFNPDQPLEARSAVSVWPGWPTLRLQGALRGFDATAQLRHSGRWQALVEGRDAWGRLSGAVGSLVTHTTGPFSGSRWALFGVTNRDIFQDAAGQVLLRRTVRLLCQPVAARAMTTNHPIYNPGEVVRLRLALCSPRGVPSYRSLSITLTLDGAPPPAALASAAQSRRGAAAREGWTTLYAERRTYSGSLPAELEFRWKPSVPVSDFVRARAVIRNAQGEVVDAIETGFCIRDARIRDARLDERIRNTHSAPSGTARASTRTTLFGTDTYANMFLSPSCSPLTWYRDLETMRNHGLGMFENLQYHPSGWRYSEEDWRRLDALIQLSQRFGLAYMAGLLVGADVAVDDATLQAQADMCRTFARRYRNVPGLIYYLNGDFRLDMKDNPDLRRLWNEFLRQNYASEEAWRAAWGPEAPGEPLGQVPVTAFSSARPFSQRSEDTRRFQAKLVERWVTALTAAIRQEDSEHPITAEYYQRPYAGIDLRLSLDGMDAANFGYFGPPVEDLAHLLATIKWNDMRRAGKALHIGEFGVKTHDAWTVERGGTQYHIARTEAEQRRQLWWLVHAALAFHVTKIQNWCWSDDPDGVFPWGVTHSNPLRPKPVLRLWRNLRFLAELVPHRYEPAPVVLLMPDAWRLGTPEPASWRRVATALQCLLATGVPFDVVNEEQAASLDASGIRLVIAPLALRMPRAVRERLMRLAADGAVVYLSGVGEGYPLPPDAGPTEPFGTGRRTVYGKGSIVVLPSAWETEMSDVFLEHPDEPWDASRNLYHALVAMVGLEPAVRLTASEGTWITTAWRSDGRIVIAAFPVFGGRELSLRSGGHEVRWQNTGTRGDAWSGWPCLVVLSEQGALLGATGVGMLAVDGTMVAAGDAPWMVAALGGQPIATCSAIAVTATESGALTIAREWPAARGHITEMKGDHGMPVGSASVAREKGLLRVTVPANELVLVTAESYPPAPAAGRAGQQSSLPARPRRRSR